jgi:hypothetical protein
MPDGTGKHEIRPGETECICGIAPQCELPAVTLISAI